MDRLFPTWLRWVLVSVFALWVANQLFDYGRDIEAKACAADRNAEVATTSEARRSEESATTQKRTEVSDEHVRAIQTLQAERDAAAAAAVSLRSQLAKAIERAKRSGSSDPSPEPVRSPVEAIGAALAACEAEYRAMGADAAERYAAGLKCEGEYDALTPNRQTPDEGSGQ